MDPDPVGVGNFTVEIGGEPVGCHEVLGLGFEAEHRRATPVTLRRSASGDLTLWSWARNPEPRTVRIGLLDARHEPVCSYLLERARPIRWAGPELVATSAGIAVEELVLAVDGIDVRPAGRDA